MQQTEFISPNLHVVLIHFPIALLIAGTLIELFSFMWRRSAFRAAGRWMILLGALTAIPTTLSGLYAMRDVSMRGLAPAQATGTWKEVSSRSLLSAHQWETLHDHAWLQIGATGLAVFVAILWIACSDLARAKLHLLFLLALLVGAWMMAAGAWHGGELVFVERTGVQSEDVGSARAYPTTTEIPGRSSDQAAATTSSSTTTTTAESESHVPQGVDLTTFFVPPIQLHLILAGITIAIALLALGLSVRKISQGVPPTQVDHIAAALTGGDGTDAVVDPQDLVAARVPAGRFWMLVFLTTLLTAGAGYWMLALHEHSWVATDLWRQFIAENMRNNELRQVAHLIAGGSIALLALILALLARWGPRQKLLLFFFALLLIGVVMAQVWFGILLLYDTRLGPLVRFN